MLEYPIDDKTEAQIKYFKDHGCTLEWAFALMLLERVEILEEKIKILKERDDYLSDDQFPMDLRL